MKNYSSILLALVPVVAVAACASQPAAPPNAASSPSSGAAPAGGASGEAKGDGKAWADSQREPFMTGCTAKVNAADYCACAFEQFREVFKDGEGQGGGTDDPRFPKLQEQTKAACSSKLPEDVVKAGFLTGCTEDDKRKAKYCECAWPALRKKLALSDFTTSFEGARFDEAKKSMAVACKGKYPSELAKADFLKGCTKDDGARSKMCECAWKKLHAKYSTEEIVAGVVDPAAAGVAECK